MNPSEKHFRVGRRVGQKLWQVKQAPGWTVVFQGATLAICAEYLRSCQADLATTPVLTSGLWQPIEWWIENRKEPGE